MTLLKPSTASSAIGALVVALIIWRADLVRLLPQSAAFDKLAGSRWGWVSKQPKPCKASPE
jgi:hypothetical protein